MNKNRHIGSNFDDFLQEEGLLAEAEATAVKRARVWEGRVAVPGEDRGDGRVSPLPELEGSVPAGWKDAVYECRR